MCRAGKAWAIEYSWGNGNRRKRCHHVRSPGMSVYNHALNREAFKRPHVEQPVSQNVKENHYCLFFVINIVINFYNKDDFSFSDAPKKASVDCYLLF